MFMLKKNFKTCFPNNPSCTICSGDEQQILLRISRVPLPCHKPDLASVSARRLRLRLPQESLSPSEYSARILGIKVEEIYILLQGRSNQLFICIECIILNFILKDAFSRSVVTVRPWTSLPHTPDTEEPGEPISDQM